MQSIFFHPDYTVGFGIQPNQPYGSRAIPPVGNHTPPWRRYYFYKHIITYCYIIVKWKM